MPVQSCTFNKHVFAPQRHNLLEPSETVHLLRSHIVLQHGLRALAVCITSTRGFNYGARGRSSGGGHHALGTHTMEEMVCKKDPSSLHSGQLGVGVGEAELLPFSNIARSSDLDGAVIERARHYHHVRAAGVVQLAVQRVDACTCKPSTAHMSIPEHDGQVIVASCQGTLE